MNYKETLFFIGKCLTINHEKHNKILVEQQLKTQEIDWDTVVKVSTSQFVFPALYINLKKANLLETLPSDLVEYMEHITMLNRERNTQIIAQAKRVNTMFTKHNITPIFTKGTAFLLQGLYDDIGERMVGDIDFLVNPENFEEAIEIATENGYYCNKKYQIIITEKHIHYPKIIKDDEIAAIEIHFRVTRDPYAKHLNYDLLSKHTITTGNSTSLSTNHHVLITCFNKQISDRGKWFESFSLRNSYDLFLLSQKTDLQKAIHNFGHYHELLNKFVASSSLLFNHPESLTYDNSRKIKKLLEKQVKNIENIKRQQFKTKLWKTYFELELIITGTVRAVYSKKYRSYFISRIKSYFSS